MSVVNEGSLEKLDLVDITNVYPTAPFVYQDDTTPRQVIQDEVLMTPSLPKGKYKVELGACVKTIGTTGRGWLEIKLLLDAVETYIIVTGVSLVAADGNNYEQMSGVYYFDQTSTTPVNANIQVKASAVSNTYTKSMYAYITKL
jgi:hypothetical protein